MTNQVVFGRRGAPVNTFRPAPRPVLVAEPEPETQRAHTKLYEETDGMERLLAGVPLFTLALAALLAGVFYLELHFAFDLGAGGQISRESSLAFGASSRDLVLGQHEFWRLGLAPLLHGGNAHLIGNLVAMVLVSIQLEPIVGRGWFAAIFAFSAVGGEVGSLVGNAPDVPSLGASGAITGIIAASFVMSFSADTAQESLRMMRRALFFGVPALLPLLWASHDANGAQGGTDYYAHLGGAVTGGVVAFVIDQTWDRAYFRPPFNDFAAVGATVLLGFSVLAAGLAARHYREYQAMAQQFIPLAEIEGDFAKAAHRAFEFQEKYPHDPVTPLLVAVHYLQIDRPSEAETELRTAMERATPLRPEAAPLVQTHARALLALTLQAERRGREARDIALPLCAPGALDEARAMVVKAKLCAKD